MTRSAAASIAVVSSPPLPCESTGSRSARDGSSASTPRTSSTAPRQSASQSVKRVEEQPAGELRGAIRGLLRKHVATARPLENGLDRRGPNEQCCLGLAAVDGSLPLLSSRRLRNSL